MISMWGGFFGVQDPPSLMNFAPVLLRGAPTPNRRTFGAGAIEDVNAVERNLALSCAINGGKYMPNATFSHEFAPSQR